MPTTTRTKTVVRATKDATNSTSSSSSSSSKPRILCLHGKHQSGSTFSNKIAGARRKLARSYDLDFLNGPLLLSKDSEDEEPAFAWWHKDEHGNHLLVRQGLEYVLHHLQQQDKQDPYRAILGFSQGGVVATALACAGLLPSVQALVTAGSPMVPEAFEIAHAMATTTTSINTSTTAVDTNGYQIPKLHLAGETDAMIPVESTRQLCERAGNGTLIVHEQGHLFPTRAARVQQVLDFLQQYVVEEEVVVKESNGP